MISVLLPPSWCPTLSSAQPAIFMTVRREIVEPRRETGARSREDPIRTRAVR